MNRSCDYSFCAFQSCEKRVCGKELRREKALVSNQRPLRALKARTHMHPATPDQAVRDWHHPNQATVATSTSPTQSHHSSRQLTTQRRITSTPSRHNEVSIHPRPPRHRSSNIPPPLNLTLLLPPRPLHPPSLHPRNPLRALRKTPPHPLTPGQFLRLHKPRRRGIPPRHPLSRSCVSFPEG